VEINFRIILNSRGQKTVECEIKENNNRFISSTPSGASTGSKEVFAFPVDGIENGIKRIKKVIPQIKKLKIEEFNDLEEVEKIINKVDKTENKEFIGGNLILALEYSLLRYYSFKQGKEVFEFLADSFNYKNLVMPKPLGNVVGGGAHSPNSLDIQEYLLLPNYKTFKENYFINAQIHKEIKEVFLKKYPNFIAAKTDEGAWALNASNIDPLVELKDLIETNDYKVDLGLDLAATQLFHNGLYIYKKDKMALSKEEQYFFVQELAEDFDLVYIEDPVEENDEEGFKLLKEEVKGNIIGDDFICTNPEILKKRYKFIDGAIVKPNQIGSLIKTKEVIDFLKNKDLIPILSHRSGETEDNILAHLAVGFQVPIIKTGIVNGERTTKLNELLRIEENIKNK
jgi:enolase